jgi:hypothetical protein
MSPSRAPRADSSTICSRLSISRATNQSARIDQRGSLKGYQSLDTRSIPVADSSLTPPKIIFRRRCCC